MYKTMNNLKKIYNHKVSMNEPTKCLYCQKKLKSFKINDWSLRKYHKKCYKTKQTLEACEYILLDYMKNELKEQK
jgi:hypothetical protein